MSPDRVDAPPGAPVSWAGLRVAMPLVVGAVSGWLVHRVLRWGAGGVLPEPGSWFVGAFAGVGLGILVARRARTSSSAGNARILLAAAGWALSASAGWSISVLVGGPLSGVATLVALEADDDAAAVLRGLRLVLMVLVGLTMGWLASGALPIPYRFVAVLLGGMLAATLVQGRPPRRRLLAMSIGWGLAWVLTWWATTWLIAGDERVLAASSELVAAFLLGGGVTAASMARKDGAFTTIVATWCLAGLLAALGAVVIALLLAMSYNLVRGGATAFTYLDIGQVLAMSIAGAAGVRHTERSQVPGTSR